MRFGGPDFPQLDAPNRRLSENRLVRLQGGEPFPIFEPGRQECSPGHLPYSRVSSLLLTVESTSNYTLDG
jgi:hypothetical protein